MISVPPMLIRTCHRPLQLDQLLLQYYRTPCNPPFPTQIRHYARKRPTPSFSAGSGNGTDPSKGPSPKQKFDAEVQRRLSAPRYPRLRRLFTPGKLVFYTILGYGLYRLYTWQTNPQRSVILNPRFFTPFILESKDQVSPSSAVFNLLSVPRGQNVGNVEEAWRQGVWSVQVMQPDLQIARSYTPVPPPPPQAKTTKVVDRGGDSGASGEEGEMPPEMVRLFVREEVKGEVSGFLHRIPLGTVVHLKGPRMELEIPEDVGEVLFLAGGTGITPALQLAYCLFKARGVEKEKLPRMRILWANRKREDSRTGLEEESVMALRGSLWEKASAAVTGHAAMIGRPKGDTASRKSVKQTRLVDEIENVVAHSDGRVSVDYYVDEEGSHITEELLRSHLSSKSSDQTMSGAAEGRKRLLLVSGPEGFIAHYAGAKEWEGGQERPGPLGGLLKKINPKGWDIWTL